MSTLSAAGVFRLGRWAVSTPECPSMIRTIAVTLENTAAPSPVDLLVGSAISCGPRRSKQQYGVPGGTAGSVAAPSRTRGRSTP
jgi:hypothetical protein